MIELVNVAPSRQTWMALLLLAALFIIIRSMLNKTRDKSSPIDLDELICEWNPLINRMQISWIRVIASGAFVLSCWMMVYLTVTGKMTEGYFGLFNTAWVAPILAAIIWGKKPPAPSGPATAITADNVTVKNP